MANGKITWKDLKGPKLGANGKPVPIPDPRVSGLRYVWQRDAHYAQFRYKLNGKWTSKGVGKVPDPDKAEDIIMSHWQDARIHDPDAKPAASYDDALELTVREDARAMRRQAMRGVDPSISEAGITLRDALLQHFRHMRNNGKSEGSITDYIEFAGFLHDWLDVPLHFIQPGEMLKRLQDIAERKASYRKLSADLKPEGTKRRGMGGRITANKALRVMRLAWRTARGLDPKRIPPWPTETFGGRWYEPRTRRGIKSAELPTWIKQVLAMENTQRRDYYLLAILTGARRESLASIRLEDIDLKRRTLHFPKPKGGATRAYTIPLSDVAMAVIKRRIAENEAEAKRAKLKPSPWLFPARSASGHISEPRASEKDGITVSFFVHGLRHTYANVASAAGVNDDHRRLLMNHSLPGDAHTDYLDPEEFEALREDQERVAKKLAAYGLTVRQRQR